MNLIKQSFEIIEQGAGIQGIYDQIALCASTCYKSTPKTGEDAKEFIEKLKQNGHTAMLEFGTVYLNMPITTHYSGDIGYYGNPYSVISESSGFKFKDKFGDNVDCYCITTNLRAMIEHTPSVDNDLREFLVEPTEFHEKRICVRFITSIGIARELCRHRTFSFAQESTRFVNYGNKDKFGEDISFIIPSWVGFGERKHLIIDHRSEPYNLIQNFTKSIAFAEKAYFNMINSSVKPEQAREVLPLCTKTEICMCGFVKDWVHFFELRALDKTGPAHPDMKALVVPLYKEFIKRGYINELD